MADYDAQIRLIVSGTRQINELEASLNRVQDLIEELNEAGANAIFGRSTNIGTYRAAIAAAQQQANAIRDQVSATQDANSELRQQALLYSQLNREQALYRRRSSAFTEESRGIRDTNRQVIELTTQLRSAQNAFSEFFKQADIQGARTINAEISSILEQLREINRVATGTKNVGANVEQLQAQADGWNLQIRALRRRASALAENEEILARLSVAERELIGLRNADMTFREEANVRLGKQELSNAEKLIKAEEEIAAMRRRDASEYERTLARQASAIARITAQGAKIAGKAAGATLDAVTFGRGPQVIRGTRNAAIRGGIGLGALGLGKLATGLGAAGAATAEFATRGLQGAVGGPAIAIIEKFAQALNSAMGGIPSAVYDALQALGNIPDALGVAAVAALALAPATNTAAKSIYNLGKAAGNSAIGKPLAGFLRDINPLAGAAYGSIEALTAGIDKLRGQSFDIQKISSAAAEVSAQLNESYKKLPLALPAAGQTSFKGSVEYDDVIGAKVGGGVRKALSDTELLVGSTGKLANRSQEAAEATLLFAERMSAGSSSASEIVEKFQQGAQEAKRIAEFVRQATELRTPSTETSAQRFIRETIERRRREAANQRSADIARERSRTLVGGEYPISQIPARGELFPGGRTETRQAQYRDLLNAQAVFAQKAEEIIASTGSLVELERRLLGGVSERVAEIRAAVELTRKEQNLLKQLNDENERSVQIIRERNRELRQRPIAQMTPQERVSQGILDPASLRQQRIQRVKRGRELQANLGRAGSEGLVGGAFPLLFGQGLGASVGGGLGGAAGGFLGGGLGFGLSLLGTALGSAFDTTVAGATELGAALNDLSTIFDKVKERTLFSSRETEKLATKLKDAGFAAEASVLAQEEIIKKIGQGGVNELKKLESSSDRLNRAWAEFNLQLQAALAGPMAGLLEWVNSIVGAANRRGRTEAETRDIFQGLSEEDQKKFNEEIIRRTFFTKNNKPGVAADQIADIRRQVAADFESRSKFRGGSTQTTPQERFQAQLTGSEAVLKSLTDQLSAIDIGKNLVDQYKQAAQEQQDLDRQRADLVEGYERAIGDIRLSVERRVQQERFSIIAQENEIIAQQSEIRLQGIRNANALLSQSLTGNELGQQLFDIVAQYTEQQLSTEDEIANRRRSLELEIQTIAFEAEQYKIDVAKQVADLNRSTAKQIEGIQLNVARKNDQFTRNRFDLEKQIALFQLRVLRINVAEERRKLQEQLPGVKDTNRRAEIEAAISGRNELLRTAGSGTLAEIEGQIQSAQKPAQTSFAGFAVGQGVSTAAFDNLNARAIALKKALNDLKKVADELIGAGNFIAFNKQLTEFADQGAQDAINQSKEISANFEALVEGKSPADYLKGVFAEIDSGRKKILESESLKKSPQRRELEELIGLYSDLAKVNIQIAETQEFFNDALSTNLDQVSSLKEEINGALAGTTAYEQALASLAARGLSPASEEAQKLIKSAQEIDRLQDKIAILNNIKEAATGFSDSLRGLVERFIELKDAGEAVKEFSKELGQKSLSFVLDLAFKPIEDALQKQFIAFGKQLGIDLEPEALKQLTELQGLRQEVASINQKIGPIVKSLGERQAAAEKAAQEAAQRAQQSQNPVANNIVNGPVSTQTDAGSLQRFFASPGAQKLLNTYVGAYASRLVNLYSEEDVIKNGESLLNDARARIDKLTLSKTNKDALYGAILSAFSTEGRYRIDEIRKLNGQGGPDLQIGPDGRVINGQFTNLGEGDAAARETLQIPVEPFGLPATSGTATPVKITEIAPSALPAASGSSTPGTDAAADVFASAGQKTTIAADEIKQSGDTFLKSLGKTVTGVAGLAAGIAGIAGGAQQIESGGIYGFLTGAAGILGGLASVTSLFGTGGVFAGTGGGAAGGSFSGNAPELNGVGNIGPNFGIPQRAIGGPVKGSSPYLVGEEGPELFIPGNNGTIISNDDLFAATRDALSAADSSSDFVGDDELEEAALSSSRSTAEGQMAGLTGALDANRRALEGAAGANGRNGADGINGASEAASEGQMAALQASREAVLSATKEAVRGEVETANAADQMSAAADSALRVQASALQASRDAVRAVEDAAMRAGTEEKLLQATRESVESVRSISVANGLNATRSQVQKQQMIAERRSEITQLQSIVSKPAKMDINYQSQVINNVEYVTVEQAERMAAMSAKRGRDLAIGALQASVKARRTAGLI